MLVRRILSSAVLITGLIAPGLATAEGEQTIYCQSLTSPGPVVKFICPVTQTTDRTDRKCECPDGYGLSLLPNGPVAIGSSS